MRGATSADLAGLSGLRARGAGPRRTPRTSDRAYEVLAEAIRDLRLPPGTALSETDLAARLGVSRTPVREAISRLATERLVHVIAQVGTSVAQIDLAEVDDACFIRAALEGAAFAAACESGAAVDRLRAILARQAGALANGDADGFFDSDEELHREVFRLAGRESAWDVVRGTKLQLDRMRRLVLGDASLLGLVYAEHERLVDLLEARDIPEGISLLQHHARVVLERAPELRRAHPAYFV